MDNTFKGRILREIKPQKPTTWGKSIGLDEGLINRIFKNGAVPTAKHLITISNALGVSIDWLLTGKESAYTGAHPSLAVNEELATYKKTSKKHQNYLDKLKDIMLHKEEDIVRMLFQSLDITHEAVEMRLGRLNHRGAFQGDHVICMKCNKVFGGRSKEDCQCKHPDLPKPPKQSSGKKTKGKGKK